jgi:NAD(P)-dependent dehydrogenase (short-subunit alcohol dehydrogenase family)
MQGVPRDSDVFASYVVNTPLGGTTEPGEVASVVSFLIEPDSSRVTGQVIAIDGGTPAGQARLPAFHRTQ